MKKIIIKFPYYLFFILLLLKCYSVSVANEPFVVLEHSGNNQSLDKNIDKNNPFLRNHSHNQYYTVKDGDSLSGIINKFYSNTGLNKKIIEVSIIQINKKAFVRDNPHYLFAGKKIKVPSINEIMNLVKNKPNSVKSDATQHIYFFGGN